MTAWKAILRLEGCPTGGMMEGLFRRRQLPHVDVEDKPYFITGCLAGSISAIGLKQIRTYRDALDERPVPQGKTQTEWASDKHKLVFKLVDSLLDKASPVRYFENDRAAEIVQNAFLHFAGERYKLLAYVVMPSHHHWLFLPDPQWASELRAKQQGQKN